MSAGEWLFSSPADLENFARALPSRAVGKNLEFHRRLGSTNDRAAQAAAAWPPAPHGWTVAAEEQTAGRGRHGRRWLAPPGEALLFSLVVRPARKPGGLTASRLGWLGLAAGLAASETLTAETGVRTTVKWPNDLVVGAAPSGGAPWRKLGGVLCESSLLRPGGAAPFAILGLGLNVNQTKARLPEVPKAPPTSLRLERGRALDRRRLFAVLLEHLETRLDDLFSEKRFPRLQSELDDHLNRWWEGLVLRVRSPSGEVQGRYAGLDEGGRLRLDCSGRVLTFADAEILGLE
jgi:BirA family biotin operon repressor/biotin-[acetyl-CoA-carboxylase] ligase